MKRNTNELVVDGNTTLLTHVRELQIRLLVTAVVLVGAGVVAYMYYAEILDILRRPLNAPLYTSSVSGDFSFVMKICMVAGIAVSVPLIIYNFIMFVRPAFIEVFTRKRVVMMTLGSVLAAAGGMLFGYYFIIPGAIHFFSGFQVSGLKSMIQADGYLNFVVNVIVTFILMFQLPIVASLIDRIKPISPKAMWKGEKWALIGSVLISLIVPFAMDFTTQILIAAPIFILYNISFVVIVVQHAYAKKVQQKADRVAARAERKAATLEARQTKKQPARRAPAPALGSPTMVAPNAQLSEVFALQSQMHGEPKKQVVKHVAAVHNPIASPSRRPAFNDFAPSKHPVKRIAHPIAPKLSAIEHAAPQPVHKAVSQPTPVPVMDMVAAPLNRMQPTQIIRSAGPISTPPQRQTSPYRSMRMMSDIR